MLKFKHFCVKSQIVTEMSYFRHILTSREDSVNSGLFTQNLQYRKEILTNTNLTQSLHNLNTRRAPSALSVDRQAGHPVHPMPIYARGRAGSCELEAARAASCAFMRAIELRTFWM